MKRKNEHMSRDRIKWPVVAAVLLLSGLSVVNSERQVAGAKDSPAVAGVVKFDGPQPKPRSIRMTEKGGAPSSCRKLHKNGLLDRDRVVSKKGEVANVFVYVSEGLEKKTYPLPKKPALMNQAGCMFEPRVQGILVGQEFLMKNSDPLIHNVRSYSMRNRPFNIAQPPKTPDRKKTFRRKENEIMIQCDFHPWMKAYIFVMDHPYFAVTNAKGEYQIKGLPAGKYTLTAWHEEFGEQEVEITVDVTGAASTGFTFKAKKKEE